MNTNVIKIFSVIFVGIVVVLGAAYIWKGNLSNPEVSPDENYPEVTEPEEQAQTPADEMLINTSWVWVRTETGEGEEFLAPEGEQFVLTFLEGGTVTSTTDCNSMSGFYVRDGDTLNFGSFEQTEMYCEGSVESVYAEFLSYTNSYAINENELRLLLSRDVGTMIFVRRN
jgi:heat shock protein HslJ